MSQVNKLIEIYQQLGVLNDCRRLSTTYNRDKKRWEVYGHFCTPQGKRNGKVAEFDDVADAIDFEVKSGVR